MKKSTVVLILLAGMLLGACSTYTCPTYTKKETKKDATQVRL